MRAELERMAADMGLGDSVVFLGERSDTVRLMAGLDLFVLPSMVEGFPNALLEAVLLGIPSVASRVGGVPDVLPEAEAMFAPGSDADALRVVLHAFDEPERALDRAGRMRKRAQEQFTASRTVDSWCALYDRCR